MSGVYHLELTESEAALKTLLSQQKSATDRDRVHLLYLLKSGQVETMQEAAGWLGRHRVTVQKWAKRYRDGGLAQLLTHTPHTGDKSTLPAWAATALRKRLEQPEGFESYVAIQDWLALIWGLWPRIKRFTSGSTIASAQRPKWCDRKVISKTKPR